MSARIDIHSRRATRAARLVTVLCLLGFGGTAGRTQQPVDPPGQEVGQIPQFRVQATDLGIQMVPMREVAPGQWLLATGPSPDRLHINRPVNINADDTTNADQLWSGGGLGLNLSGSGYTVGVWDGGTIRSTHQEFGSRVTVVDTPSIEDHATHVAGTIGAAGVVAAAKGAAPAVSIRSREWTDDTTEMNTDAALIDASNHSYSYIQGWETGINWGVGPVDTWFDDRDTYSVEDPNFGQYDTDTQSLDQVLNDNPHLMSFWSAGNDRNDSFTGLKPFQYVTYLSTTGGSGPGWYLIDTGAYPPPPSDGNGGTGYDCLSQMQTAKNSIVVGSILDITADPYNSSHVSMNTFSCWGPTDDGRVKPDIVGNGNSLYSCISTNNTAYGTYSGTSMASPNVCGSAVLLLEHFEDLWTTSARSATMKAIMIQTAFDAGNTGPDYQYGWGILDCAAAVNFMNDAYGGGGSGGCHLREFTYSGSQQYYDMYYDGVSTIVVTMVWNDPQPASVPPAGLDVTSSVLVNDLDLTVWGDSANYPWTLDPTAPANAAVRSTANHRDNVEQVAIDTPSSAGIYRIFVNHTGGAFTQNYTLAMSGLRNPTAVRLVSLEATQSGDQVRVAWRTGYEADNLGFHVYRQANGERVRLTPQLVAGSALLAGARVPLTAGRSYAWLDPVPDGAGSVQYYIEDVDINGRRTLHGPVTPVVASASLPGAAEPTLLSALGTASVPAARSTVQGVAALAPRPIGPAVGGPEGICRGLPAGRGGDPDLLREDTQRILAAGPAVKIAVGEEGWYRVAQSALVAAGLDPSVDPRQLQLYVDGQQVPLVVVGDGGRSLGPDAAIEFYAVGQDTPWTAMRTYWLVAGERPGERVQVVGGWPRAVAGPASFLYTVEKQERTIYFAALKNGDADNFFGPLVSGDAVDQVLQVLHIDRSAAPEATLQVALQGVTAGAHAVTVSLNDIEVGTVNFAGTDRGVATLVISPSLLADGDNRVTHAAQGGETDVSLIDSIRLTYARTYTADEGVLKCTAPGGTRVTIGGFDSGDVRVVDITEPTRVCDLTGRASRQGGGYAVTVTVRGPGERTLLAFSGAAVKKPAALAANQPSQWHQEQSGSDLLIIAPGAFLEAVEPLAQLREQQGLSVALIDVEDIYDEFNFGAKSADAVREFIRSAWAQGQKPPRFVLFVGDASFDPRDYLGFGDFDFVPTKQVETAFLETASDDWFVDMDEDGLPELAVGRLPVQSPEEAARVVAKIIAYETGEAGPSNAIMVADVPDVSNYEAASLRVGALLPADMEIDGIFVGNLGAEAARAELLEQFNQGASLVSFIGHGSVDIWAHGLFSAADARGLANGDRLPLVLSMTCLNGLFHDVLSECMAEALLKAENGGAAAVWASSGLTEPAAQECLNKAFVQLLYGGEVATIGEAAARAKAAVDDPDVRRTWILFGDPALRLK